MRIDPIELEPKQTLFRDYKKNFEKIADRFGHAPFDKKMWNHRLSELKEQTYQRTALSEVLLTMNRRWRAPEKTLESVDKLKDEESVVIIAGQQAGLLTGPLYSVHKIISVLQLAKEKERDLGKPVIPVFWIAGEDHDFDEIHHVMMNQGGEMRKRTIAHTPESKASVSDIAIDQTKASDWLKQVFQLVKETEHTQDFYKKMDRLLRASKTYTDFFAKVVYYLFPDEGLVLMDAHHPDIRRLESPYFTTMIHQNDEIARGVYAMLQKNRQEGYETMLDSEWSDAHLFYHKEGERILLVRDEQGRFVGKNNEVVLTKEEMLKIAEESPEFLSNNVVTRPLMQEALFPVLAFIGGPGEINYWSALKPAFEATGLCMPPVFPRLSFTMIDRKTGQQLERLQLSTKEAIHGGVREQKLNWIASQSTPPISRLTEQVKNEIDRVHAPLREKSASLSTDLGELAEKNLEYLLGHIDFLEKRLQRSMEERHQHEMEQFDNIEVTLHPAGGLQERMWSIVPWVNHYGRTVFEQINRHHLSFENDHYVVYL
ncbi:bacillithiol biosynthesis cysteine-adding enzyme BshC [Halobacillus karajensis]|uniref:Putative cysteine ligase BshC n=1 Tax=Halobacillus karajensis TaxID=195088 RepID=A0A024P2D5_9BACI|nr:bacillithiol biosynthesis cysteine-adding enzyme BshC [Halobacillus karajensis]CDQ19850.1 bacillithiol biosynthesis cysteine-adding enzyme BshC [Halobacillus karajensis]CDQ22310.1 bacillithiol biosynthesis cysteine-adding enzyme BshC [Halobacillus karajensis]CDQ28151.1 bacillithiol biosynthesis cysteine-adding enzyme BshC [Halobacillus karajensis]